ncbi:hypothetical protein G6F64_007160 [Rhizopus arrhizus]|uniref:RRM domain-containing protein n=1 Tax=Rhizopus oryzae TaxID=64495 RepID=A0A9P6X7Z7_RHIOR|nr:hypothetical protein G6F64_007160 [Rhizopus arrhizus]
MPVTRKSTTNKSEKKQAPVKAQEKKQTAVKTQEKKPAAKKQVTKVAVKEPAKKAVAATKKPAKKAEPKELESSDEEEEEKDSENEEEFDEEQEDALRKKILGDLASSSEGEDSSDDEDLIGKNEDIVALDDKKMKESMEETKKTFNKKQAQSKKVADTSNRSVIYLGRIPHGFYEKEMKAYFEQFGKVTRLRLSRNRKTGASRHFGFIEFKEAEVAEIVAETMHNYLLFGHLLQCKVIPSESVHPELFKGAGKNFKVRNHRARNIQVQNRKRSGEELKAQHDKLRKTEGRIRDSLKAAGISYDFPGYDAKA